MFDVVCVLYHQNWIVKGQVYWDVIRLLLLIFLMTVRWLTPDPQTSLHPCTSICMQMGTVQVHVHPYTAHAGHRTRRYNPYYVKAKCIWCKSSDVYVLVKLKDKSHVLFSTAGIYNINKTSYANKARVHNIMC